MNFKKLLDLFEAPANLNYKGTAGTQAIQQATNQAKPGAVQNVNKIRVGQNLTLPGGGSYQVKAGDTMDKIARRNPVPTAPTAPTVSTGPAPSTDNEKLKINVATGSPALKQPAAVQSANPAPAAVEPADTRGATAMASNSTTPVVASAPVNTADSLGPGEEIVDAPAADTRGATAMASNSTTPAPVAAPEPAPVQTTNAQSNATRPTFDVGNAAALDLNTRPGVKMYGDVSEEDEELNELMRLSGRPVNEKAVSKQQQKFMGMVHAMQKGKKIKGASPELKKVAKTMNNKDAKDFASTKHKGLPTKVSESVMLEAGSALEHIINKFKHETKNFLAGEELDHDLFESLFDYYSDNGEMPYAIRRTAGDTDPYQWIDNKFEKDLEIMGYPRDFNAPNNLAHDHELTELARLAGLTNEDGPGASRLYTRDKSGMGAVPKDTPKDPGMGVAPKTDSLKDPGMGVAPKERSLKDKMSANEDGPGASSLYGDDNKPSRKFDPVDTMKQVANKGIDAFNDYEQRKKDRWDSLPFGGTPGPGASGYIPSRLPRFQTKSEYSHGSSHDPLTGAAQAYAAQTGHRPGTTVTVKIKDPSDPTRPLDIDLTKDPEGKWRSNDGKHYNFSKPGQMEKIEKMAAKTPETIKEDAELNQMRRIAGLKEWSIELDSPPRTGSYPHQLYGKDRERYDAVQKGSGPESQRVNQYYQNKNAGSYDLMSKHADQDAADYADRLNAVRAARIANDELTPGEWMQKGTNAVRKAFGGQDKPLKPARTTVDLDGPDRSPAHRYVGSDEFNKRKYLDPKADAQYKARQKALFPDDLDEGKDNPALKECGDMSMDSQRDSMNVSTNMSSDGNKSVNISAQGDQADALLQMLKMAGMRPHDNDHSMAMTEPEVIMVSSAPQEEMMDEEYANEPEQEYQTIDSIIRQGNDLNREKRQYADKPKLGDNPMAEGVYDPDYRGNYNNEFDELEDLFSKSAMDSSEMNRQRFLSNKHGINSPADMSKLPALRKDAETGYKARKSEIDADTERKNQQYMQDKLMDLEYQADPAAFLQRRMPQSSPKDSRASSMDLPKADYSLGGRGAKLPNFNLEPAAPDANDLLDKATDQLDSRLRSRPSMSQQLAQLRNRTRQSRMAESLLDADLDAMLESILIREEDNPAKKVGDAVKNPSNAAKDVGDKVKGRLIVTKDPEGKTSVRSSTGRIRATFDKDKPVKYEPAAPAEPEENEKTNEGMWDDVSNFVGDVVGTEASKLRSSQQLRDLDAMRKQYKGTPYEKQVNDRYDTHLNRLQLDKGDVMDYDPKTGIERLKPVVPPDQWKGGK